MTESNANGPGIVVHRKRGYTVVYNDLLPDGGRLSARAWGIFVYLLGRPDGWTCRASHLATVFKEGRDAIYTALSELAALELMEREPYYEGNLRRVRYALHADPEPHKRRSAPETDSQEPEDLAPVPGSQEPGAPDADAPGPEMPGQASKEGTTTEVATTEVATKPGGARQSQIAQPFAISDRCKAWAAEKFPRVPIEFFVAETEHFVGYHLAKANRYADWDLAWMNWMRRAAPKAMTRQPPNRLVDTGDTALHERQDAMFEGTG